MNSIRDKVIECLSSKGWDREDEEWETESKIIPYIRFSNPIMPENDDDSRYCVAVTVWGKSVTTDITEYSVSCGDPTIWRVAKVTHAEFLERSHELIQSAHQYLYQNFNP